MGKPIKVDTTKNVRLKQVEKIPPRMQEWVVNDRRKKKKENEALRGQNDSLKQANDSLKKVIIKLRLELENARH